jgi:hypothetical protein
MWNSGVDYVSTAGWYRPKPAATGWTPASLPGLLLWLDASNSGSITQSAGSVSQWNDLSGNGNNVAQPTGANRPTYSATGFNGTKPGITFTSGSSQWIQNASVALNSAPFNVFVVLTTPTSGASNSGVITLLGTGQSNDYDNLKSFAFVATSAWRMAILAPFDDSSMAITINTPVSVGWSFDGTNGSGYLNNAIDAYSPTGKTGAFGNTTANIVMGARQVSGIGGNYFDGTFGEVVMWTGAPSSTDRTNLYSYWKTTKGWGLP